ncbi:hypothetical protein OG898_35535 [Streptomyces sp. NBC_00193]|uniref:hypothetical protein n=1 Tax=Streptomyces sp. NBC_00193 TaxID=2975675 RepID=UPI0022550D3F|nr:hypothetical protein [Streptomyces sp. NBC_00193]MCX5301724.1 hypothetical protein [Streptomyces sp. NBC_00193]
MVRTKTAAAGVAALALLLMASAGTAFAVRTADQPTPLATPMPTPMSTPLADGARLSASPGERLTFTLPASLPGKNGNRVVSEVFVAPGTLRMNDPVVTAVATVACDTPPGVYPVRQTGPGGPAEGAGGEPWVSVEVADIGAAERAACPGKVAALPPEQPEEHWPAGRSWPQSPWDVRTFRPGEEVTPTASDASAGYGDTLTSPGFTGRAVMRGAKAVVTAAATIRCDAGPGLYEVRWAGGDEVWARYRVADSAEQNSPACRDRAAEPSPWRTPWPAAGAAAALAAAGVAAYAVARRRRRPR